MLFLFTVKTLLKILDRIADAISVGQWLYGNDNAGTNLAIIALVLFIIVFMGVLICICVLLSLRVLDNRQQKRWNDEAEATGEGHAE